MAQMLIKHPAITLFISVLLSRSTQSVSCDTTDPTIIDTNYGCVEGSLTDLGRQWLSIPYATPPTPENDLRFKDPIAASVWTDILDATNVAPACMQNCEDKGVGSIWCYLKENATMSEDCLYLNIYSPIKTANETDVLPVMFFIHGGSYLHGWSGSELYNGAVMAAMNDVIVVTINYRLGAFGFLYDSDNGYTGNYGYKDQLLALLWVHENIEYFGGDTDKVVIFGESAGAMSVGTILMDTSADTIKLYSGAIMESNPLGLPFRIIDSWDTLPSKLYDESGCSDSSDISECMKNKDSTTLIAAQHNVDEDLFDECSHFRCYWIHKGAPWTPTFQTEALPQVQPLNGFASGEFNKNATIIIGTNKNEAVPFVFGFLNGIFGSYDDGLCGIVYDLMLYAVFGYEDGEKIKDYFKDDQPDCFGGDYRELLSKVTSQFMFVCPTRKSAESASQYSNKNVYVFSYNHLYSDSESIYYDEEVCKEQSLDNVCHADELPIVFQSDGLTFTDKEKALSDLIQVYWTTTAKNGDPTHVDTPWSPFVEDTQYTMVFDEDGSAQVANYANDNYDCALWDEIGYVWLDVQEAQCGDHCWSDEVRRLLDLPDFCTQCDDELDQSQRLRVGVVYCTVVFAVFFVFNLR